VGYHIYYAAGRVYSSAGPVIDAARHEVVGSLSGLGNGIAVDAALGRMYVADDYLDRLRVLDVNNFQVLGEIAMSFGYAGRLVHWGTDGLAVMDSDRIFITRTSIPGL
jgi:DNA-binding beta-propeller fold protein YncE